MYYSYHNFNISFHNNYIKHHLFLFYNYDTIYYTLAYLQKIILIHLLKHLFLLLFSYLLFNNFIHTLDSLYLIINNLLNILNEFYVYMFQNLILFFYYKKTLQDKLDIYLILYQLFYMGEFLSYFLESIIHIHHNEMNFFHQLYIYHIYHNDKFLFQYYYQKNYKFYKNIFQIIFHIFRINLILFI